MTNITDNQLEPHQSSNSWKARSNIDKQTDIMASLKLKRILEVNQRLRDDLSRDRIYASNACLAIIRHTQNTRDLCIPTMWGYLEDDRSEYDSQPTCCTIS